MGILAWFGENGFERIQSAGIIGSFLLGAYAAWRDERARKISNRIAIGQQHWAIWKEVAKEPKLSRVLAREVDLGETPVTLEERLIVTQIILQLQSVFHAMKAGMYVQIEGLQQDAKGFFSLPIPKAIWESSKQLQNRKFVQFLENCLKN